MTLKNFPRGGKKTKVKVPSESLLFKNASKPKKKRDDRKKEAEETTKDDTAVVVNTAERLSYATLCEGLIILGRIYEVSEYDLIVSLPGGIVGRVQVTDISESYTNLLQSIIKSDNAQPDEFKSLPELYAPGDNVVCYVKSLQPEEKWQVVLSLEPRLINQNVDINYLSKGSKIVCTVSSIEDHGYVVDMGIINVRAFVPSKEINRDISYYPGKQLLCHVKEIKISDTASTVKLSASKARVHEASTIEVKSLDVLMPGTKFALRVKKVLSNGLKISFGKSKTGYINQLYLDEPLSSYEKGMEIGGTLLYILPTLKFGYFSLLVDKPKPESLKPGDIIGKATALFREANGIVVQLTESGLRGFIPLKRTDVDYDQVVNKFTPGTMHKCRVLSYNWMDSTFVCTMQRTLMEQRYFFLTDVKPGDITNVRIKNVNIETGFVNVYSGKINGYVAPEHVSDSGLSSLKRLKDGDQVEARVLYIDNVRNKVSFTLKKSLITSDLPILSNIHEAKCKRQHHGTVVQINKNGLLVRFYGDVKGWVPRNSLNTDTSDVNWNYSVGQTVVAKIESVDASAGKMKLTIPTKNDEREECNFAIGERVEGTVTQSSVHGVYLRILKNKEQTITTGFLPAGHMSPCSETAALLASKCIPGDTLSALVFAISPSLILSRTFVPQEDYRNFHELKIGDCIPCSIRDIEQDGVRVILPLNNCTPFGYVAYNKISNYNLLHVNQILFTKVVSINKKEKRLGLTLSLKKIYDELSDSQSKSMVAVDVLNLYFNKILELAQNPFYENRPISSVKLGQKVTGKVQKVTTDGLVVQLENNLLGIVQKDHYQTKLKVGDSVTGSILWINYIHEFVNLTLVPAIMRDISIKQTKELSLPPGTLVRARILMITNWFILILLKDHEKSTLAALPARRHLNDVQPELSPYTVHTKFQCYIMLDAEESNIMPICMVKSVFGNEEVEKEEEETVTKSSLKRKKTTVENDAASKSIKKVKTNQNGNADSKKQENTCAATNDKVLTKHRKEKKLRTKNEDENMELQDDKEKEGNVIEEKPRITECGFFWDDKSDVNLLSKHETSSDSEDETEQEPKQKKKKLNSAERREQERQKEREIRQREEALASNQLPNSIDQFDRMVLASPDSSLIWLQYMAFHLQGTEIEKARAVARRAIKTISFREENEKLNVWYAWLNLESKFGTPESLNDVFQEAVRTNDSLKVYMHMLTVHSDANRQSELEKMINTIVGKFKQNPQVWIDCGTALLKLGLKDKSRHIMQRALQSLPASHHVNLMVRFAIIENKFGDKERSQTLFEQILSSYPKRVDVWSSYVDSLIKSNDIDVARKVLERATVQTLPARKMKTLFTKFITFEEQHGTTEGVARVQQMAAEYVEKQCKNECT